MKTASSIIVIFLLATGIVAGCSKKDEQSSLTKEELVARLLTGTGNKVWRLKAVKVNDVPQTLTAYQLTYTKTYMMAAPNTTMGRFTDQNNYEGEWSMKGAAALQETFSQNNGGYSYRDYIILSVSADNFNAYYVANNTKVEELYYAF